MLSSLHKVVRGLRLVDNVRNISISSAKLTANSSSDDDDKRNKAKLKLESLLQDIVNMDLKSKLNYSNYSLEERARGLEVGVGLEIVKFIRTRGLRHIGKSADYRFGFQK